MNHWTDQLRNQLQHLRSEHQLRFISEFDRCSRIVRHNNKQLICFAGNDYLSLASEPALANAASNAANTFGVGSGASQLITGYLEPHHKLAERLAQFKRAQAALILPTGYMANLAVITTLAAHNDLICLDKLCHASIIDAARASGAHVRTFAHRDTSRLEHLLEKTTIKGKPIRRRIIVTDTVFSMDGDCTDLAILCDLRDRFDAIIIIDEAHATGVLGENGSGLAEAQGVADRIDVTISTAGKALGSLGGIITASQLVIDAIINLARPFIFTTSVPPTQIATINAALDIVRDQPERRIRLRKLSHNLRSALQNNGWPVSNDDTPIIPLVLGTSTAALDMSNKLLDAGLLVPAIRPPTVAPNSARLRISLRADHLDNDIQHLVDAIGPNTFA